MKQIDLIKVLVLLDWNRLKMLNESDLERYSRQLIIPEIDEEGQLILLNSNILIIGAGGLGNPAAIFCTAAGIGSIDICDYDKIELSNLNRQIAYSVSDIGLPKSDVLKKYCLKLNSNLNINSFDIKFDENFSVSKYDIILDCSDNITTRYNANFLAHTNKKVLISGSATQFEGQLAVFKSGNDKNAPCYECVFPKNQHEETNLNCIFFITVISLGISCVALFFGDFEGAFHMISLSFSGFLFHSFPTNNTLLADKIAIMMGTFSFFFRYCFKWVISFWWHWKNFSFT